MDNTTSVLTALQSQLGPETIQKMAAQLGTDSAAASNAVSMAIPILLGGLSKNASNAEGAASLDSALAAHDGSILENFRDVLRNGAGASILAHILGPRTAPVAEGVGRASGVTAQQAGQLLTMLAPLVMGVLGHMKRNQSVGAERLPEVLGQANLEMTRQSPQAGDLSRVLETEGDGKVADEVARIGSLVLGGMLGQTAAS